jgi:hypothetical protein
MSELFYLDTKLGIARTLDSLYRLGTRVHAEYLAERLPDDRCYLESTLWLKGGPWTVQTQRASGGYPRPDRTQSIDDRAVLPSEVCF